MVNQARFVKVALVFSGTLAVSMGLVVLPAFSQTNLQANSLANSLAQPSETDMAAQINPSVLSAPPATLPVIEPIVEAITEPITELTAESEMAMIEVAEALKSDIAELQATASSTPSEEVTETEVANAPAQALTPDEISRSTSASTPSAAVTETNSAAIASLLETANLESGSWVIEADSVPALRAALNSDNALTQLYAADALWTLTKDRDLILPTLISVAAGGHLPTRELATAAIGYLGRQALPAIPFLNRLLGENNSRTQEIAQTALEVINSNNRPATTLGILTQESRRQGVVPTVIRALTRLWRFR